MGFKIQHISMASPFVCGLFIIETALYDRLLNQDMETVRTNLLTMA